MKKKTKLQKAVIRNHGLWPFMWGVVEERERYLVIRNWFSLQYMYVYK